MGKSFAKNYSNIMIVTKMGMNLVKRVNSQKVTEPIVHGVLTARTLIPWMSTYEPMEILKDRL